jgi:ribosome-associated heat shock protein Hsp15
VVQQPRARGELAVERVRVDKWLWAARFFKTRSAATEAVAGGHVKVNGERAKPSREVAVGERVEVRTSAERWTVDVRALADRRGPAAAARALYEETPESAAAREERRLEAKASRPLGADLGARPTKRDRRRLDALRRGQRRR